MSDFFNPRAWTLGIKRHKKPLGDTSKLYGQIKALRASSPLAGIDATAFAIDVIKSVLSETKYVPSENILLCLIGFIENVYNDEALTELTDAVLEIRPDSKDAMDIREYLRRQSRFIENYDM